MGSLHKDIASVIMKAAKEDSNSEQQCIKVEQIILIQFSV